MAIKDQTMTTDVDADGKEFVSEINATYTETLADGTHVEAEITTTADPNDPTQIESQMTVTETAADGTETVTEVVANADGTFIVEEESALEEIVEAAFGVEIDDNLTPITSDGEVVTGAETDVYEAESDFETTGADFTVGGEMFDPNFTPTETSDVFGAAVPFDSGFGTTDAAYSAVPIADTPYESPVDAQIEASNLETSEAEAAEIAGQEAHTAAATDAQSAADEFIAQGDYAAAAEARETAENEAWEAGDDSMLSAYDAGDLNLAADKQEQAEFYNEQQTQFAQAGDYEAARDAADKSAYATYEADSSAGGADHTGQADAEKYNMDNAVWQEGIAETDMENAAYYAEAGNFDAAESSLDSAAAHQASADHYGDLGEHGGVSAVYDSSSEVATGGTYDSTYDATSVDTGFDASVDMSATSTYDTGTDDI